MTGLHDMDEYIQAQLLLAVSKKASYIFEKERKLISLASHRH